jgi:hypothetical protein
MQKKTHLQDATPLVETFAESSLQPNEPAMSQVKRGNPNLNVLGPPWGPWGISKQSPDVLT